MSSIGELRLALAWNRFDMVQAAVFSAEARTAEATEDAEHQQHAGHAHLMRQQSVIRGEDLVSLMPFALEHSRVDFVKEFLERGLPLGEYLTVVELLRLYQTVCIELSYVHIKLNRL